MINAIQIHVERMLTAMMEFVPVNLISLAILTRVVALNARTIQIVLLT